MTAVYEAHLNCTHTERERPVIDNQQQRKKTQNTLKLKLR